MANYAEIRRRLESIIKNPPGWGDCEGTDYIDAQQYAGGWRAPTWGCDSLDILMDALKAILADWPGEALTEETP